MSFSIVFYNNTSENNKLDKNLTEVMTLDGVLRNETSLLKPSIQIEASASTFSPAVNYMYIEEFGRYYYIDDVQSVRNNVTIVTGHVDVLKTYAAQIRACKAIIRRQENDWNLYINDGSLITYANDWVQAKNFPGSFDDESFILMVNGGAGNPIP